MNRSSRIREALVFSHFAISTNLFWPIESGLPSEGKSTPQAKAIAAAANFETTSHRVASQKPAKMAYFAVARRLAALGPHDTLFCSRGVLCGKSSTFDHVV